jgi:hypothetical protein
MLIARSAPGVRNRMGHNEILDCQLSNGEAIQEPFRASLAAQKRRNGKLWFSTESSADR